MDKRTASH